MIKVLYIVRHKDGSYLKSFQSKIFTQNIQEAMRAGTWDEAQKALNRVCPVPLCWDVVPIEYETLQGKVIFNL